MTSVAGYLQVVSFHLHYFDHERVARRLDLNCAQLSRHGIPHVKVPGTDIWVGHLDAAGFSDSLAARGPIANPFLESLDPDEIIEVSLNGKVLGEADVFAFNKIGDEQFQLITAAASDETALVLAHCDERGWSTEPGGPATSQLEFAATSRVHMTTVVPGRRGRLSALAS